jgi:hypothetical protein
MKAGKLVSGVVVCWLAAGAPAFADVQVTMQNGRVSVVAKDATLRQILTEWARVGQAKVVNVERIPGAPMTIELRDIPEAQALEILLRPLSGYMAAPRASQAPNLSRFDRIVVMPTMAAARQPVTTAAAPPPVFQQPQNMLPSQVLQPPDPNEDDERQAPGVLQNPGPPRPVFSAFPQPQIVSPNGAPVNTQQPGYVPPPGMQLPTDAQKAPTPSAFPTAAPGVAVPGMIVPVPPQPGVNPNQPPTRRPGGPVGQ